jgi:hypothetical protein
MHADAYWISLRRARSLRVYRGGITDPFCTILGANLPQLWLYILQCECAVMPIACFIILTRVVKRYRYRERDEPSKERQYAEEYYSNPQLERLLCQ